MDDDTAAKGVEHLQAAALELIGAARAFLDIAEEFVADRERMSEAASAFSSFAAAVARAASADTETSQNGSNEDHVERITLS